MVSSKRSKSVDGSRKSSGERRKKRKARGENRKSASKRRKSDEEMQKSVDKRRKSEDTQKSVEQEKGSSESPKKKKKRKKKKKGKKKKQTESKGKERSADSLPVEKPPKKLPPYIPSPTDPDRNPFRNPKKPVQTWGIYLKDHVPSSDDSDSGDDSADDVSKPVPSSRESVPPKPPKDVPSKNDAIKTKSKLVMSKSFHLLTGRMGGCASVLAYVGVRVLVCLRVSMCVCGYWGLFISS